MLARVLTRDDHNQFRDLAMNHPLIELRHDLFDVGFYLVVRGDEHREAILLDRREILSGVDAALKSAFLSVLAQLQEGIRGGQNCVYGVLELCLLVINNSVLMNATDEFSNELR